MFMRTYEESPNPQEIKKKFFSGEKFKAGKIPEEEHEHLFRLYGFQVQQIRPLKAEEACFFSGREFVSPGFFIQTLYKLRGAVKPLRFRQIVQELMEDVPILRTNFYRARSADAVWSVVRRGRKPAIAFHSLNGLQGQELDAKLANIMEADRRHPFLLESDLLFRLAVFRTNAGEYALLLTQPQIIADSWDARDLFLPLFPDEEIGKIALPAKRKFSFAAYLKLRKEQDEKPALRYWKKLLAELPEQPQLPGRQNARGAYRQEVGHLLLPMRDVASIRQKAGDKGRSAWMAILQSAWGLLLQMFSNSQDTYSFLLLSNRTSNLQNVNETAAILNMFPVRMQCAPGMAVKEFVKKLQLQIVVSQPMSYCCHEDLWRAIGCREDPFGHFLSFHGFLTESRSYSKIAAAPGVVPIAINSIDAQGRELGVYFRYDGDAIAVEFFYNAHSFTRASIDHIMQQYRYVLHAMLQYWEKSVGELKTRLAPRFQAAKIHDHLSPGLREIVEFLQEVEIFRSLPVDQLQTLAERSALRAYLENDIILGLRARQAELLIIVKGKAARYREGNDGWFNPVDVVKEKQMANEFALIHATSALIVEAITEHVSILAIPMEEIKRLFLGANDVGWEFSCHLLHELDKYQRRWAMG